MMSAPSCPPLGPERAALLLADPQALHREIGRLQTDGVQWVMAQFVDLQGVAKGKCVPLAHLPDVLNPGAGFAGPSIEGTGLPRQGPRSEYYGRGVLDTLQRLPWQPDTVRLVCDGFVASQPFAACSRQTLKRQCAALARNGWRLQVGIEPEFFLLRQNAQGHWVVPDTHDALDKPSYDLKALQREPVAGCLRTLTAHLLALGFDVQQLDHEDAPGQYELNYRHDEALAAADRFVLFKLAAHAIAERHGLLFSLMPKPFADRPGSGLHFHLSLQTEQGDEPMQDGQGSLSALGRFALGGLLAHAPALTALHAPTLNSYRRLRSGGSRSGTTWAPVQIGWGHNNRTTTARVTAGRVEWRVPDGSTNVYLALAGVMAAMMDGIERQLDPGSPRDHDLYAQTDDELALLPTQLDRALEALAADTRLIDRLGPEVSQQVLALGAAELQAWSEHVPGWEWRRYAGRF